MPATGPCESWGQSVCYMGPTKPRASSCKDFLLFGWNELMQLFFEHLLQNYVFPINNEMSASNYM